MATKTRPHDLAALVLFGVVCTGCDPDRPPGLSKRNAKMEDVPAVVLKAAEAKVPGVKFTEVWKNLDREGKLHSYEIRGRAANGAWPCTVPHRRYQRSW